MIIALYLQFKDFKDVKECVKKREPFYFVLRLIGFIQPAYCASIVNKTIFKKIRENIYSQVYFLFP